MPARGVPRGTFVAFPPLTVHVLPTWLYWFGYVIWHSIELCCFIQGVLKARRMRPQHRRLRLQQGNDRGGSSPVRLLLHLNETPCADRDVRPSGAASKELRRWMLQGYAAADCSTCAFGYEMQAAGLSASCVAKSASCPSSSLSSVCSGHGTCSSGSCTCRTSPVAYEGADCATRSCPNKCSGPSPPHGPTVHLCIGVYSEHPLAGGTPPVSPHVGASRDAFMRQPPGPNVLLLYRRTRPVRKGHLRL